VSTAPTVCDVEGCSTSAERGRYCEAHECATGGCSMPNVGGDGGVHCSTHECAATGCGGAAFGNEMFCVNHLD
jgi:hypothetical protein